MTYTTIEIVDQSTPGQAVVAQCAIEALVVGCQRQAFEHTLGDGFNQIPHWSRLPDWHNQPLTPNPDTIYFMPFFDTTG